MSTVSSESAMENAARIAKIRRRQEVYYQDCALPSAYWLLVELIRELLATPWRPQGDWMSDTGQGMSVTNLVQSGAIIAWTLVSGQRR